MNARSSIVLGFLVALPLSTGCAARTAPFDKLDDAQMTILKLQADTAATSAVPGLGSFPIPIPGMTPEMQQQIQTGLGGIVPQLQQVIPGLPGIPGLTQQPATQAAPKYNGYLIAGQQYGDDDLKDELLDLFGDQENFSPNMGQCFTPGMAVIFTPPDGSPNVEVMISINCNQVAGNQWPYAERGMQPEAQNTVRNIYGKLFGAPPPNGQY